MVILKSPTTYIQGTDEDEQSQTMRPPPSRPKPRPTFKGKQAIERTGTKLKTEKEKMVEENSDIEELEQIPQRKRKATYSEVEKREKPQKIADESGSDVEMTRKGKGKKKVERDSDAEMIRAGKGKAKAMDQTDDEAVEGKTRKRDRAKTGAASGSEDVGPLTKKKSASRAPSKQPPKASASVQEIGDKEDGDPKPTKKRKIRIFNPAQPPMFSFNLNNTSVSDQTVASPYALFICGSSGPQWIRYPYRTEPSERRRFGPSTIYILKVGVCLQVTRYAPS